MDTSPHEFEAAIVEHDVGGYCYTVVFLPRELHTDLPLKEHPRLRIDADIDGRPHSGALMPVGGRWYLLLSKRVLKALGRTVGDRVYVRFHIADQHAVEVPDELRFALEANARAGTAWSAATPGKRRGLAYRVSSAKRAETRERRVEEVIAELTAG